MANTRTIPRKTNKRSDGRHEKISDGALMPISWEMLHDQIEDFVMGFIKKSKKHPTIEQIAKGVGCSEAAINNHLRELDLDKVRQYTRVFTPKVLRAQATRATAGKKQDVELFMALNHDWTAKKEITIKDGQGYEGMTPEERMQRMVQIFAKGTGKSEEEIGRVISDLVRVGGVGNINGDRRAVEEAAFVEV